MPRSIARRLRAAGLAATLTLLAGCGDVGLPSFGLDGGYWSDRGPTAYQQVFEAGMDALAKGDNETARHNFEIAARSGHPFATVALAKVLLTKTDPRDPTRAASLLEDAAGKASRKQAEAHYLLAQLLARGDGVAKDEPRALELFRYAEKQNQPGAAFELARLLEAREGEAGRDSWLPLYREAAASGDSRAAERLVVLKAATAEDTRLAAAAAAKREKTLLARAEAGDSRAMRELAARLERKEGGANAGSAAAEHWLERAARAGDAEAAGRLARTYLSNARDPARAAAFAQMAVDGGDQRMLVTFGRALLAGKAVKADPARGIALLERAAAGGDLDAMYIVGKAYMDGKPVPRDLGKARHWLARAAEGGSAGAGKLLARI